MDKQRFAGVDRVIVVGVMSFMSFGPRVLAGDLTVSWPSSGAAGYRVYVGEQAGVYARVIDAGSARSTTLRSLDDDRRYYFAVKGYDAEGRLAPSFSPELVCMARPRLTSVDVSNGSRGGRAGDTISVTLHGANLDENAVVRATHPGLRVLESTSGGPGSLELRVQLAPGIQPAGAASASLRLAPSMFSVINPCRRSGEFMEAHPEMFDLDGSGNVDERDLAAVRESFGAHLGDAEYRSAADLDGDGEVDGGDLARVLSRLPSGPSPLPGDRAAARADGAE